MGNLKDSINFEELKYLLLYIVNKFKNWMPNQKIILIELRFFAVIKVNNTFLIK